MVSHAVEPCDVEVAVHAHPGCVSMVMAPLWPGTGTSIRAGATWYPATWLLRARMRDDEQDAENDRRAERDCVSGHDIPSRK